MTDFDLDILRAHISGRLDESAVTKEKRAQRRLEAKDLLIRVQRGHNITYCLSRKGLVVVETIMEAKAK